MRKRLDDIQIGVQLTRGFTIPPLLISELGIQFEIVPQFLFGEVSCAVERHVLDEMGQPLLLVGLQDLSLIHI